MPISGTDPRYLAEYEPPEIAAMRGPLCSKYGRPGGAFGARGDLNHASGYHRSFAWIVGSPDSRYGWSDYSVRQSLDTEGLPDRNACSAFDFTPGSWGTAENRRRMVEITTRVYNAAKARDPRLAALREFAGTLNGSTVVTFNCSDGSLKSPFDSSHLDHIHASLWRSRCRWDHSGILEILMGDELMGDLPNIPGLSVEQAVEDLWRWVVSDRHTDRPALDTSRFHFPVPTGEVRAKLDTLLARPTVTVDAAAVGAALAGNAAFVDAVAAGVAARVTPPPTAEEIAEAVADEDHARSAE